MVRTILAVIGLLALLTLGGVVFAGYEVYQTTSHAMAAVSAFSGKMPPGMKQPTLKPPAGFSPAAGTPTPSFPASPLRPATGVSHRNGGRHVYYPRRPTTPVFAPAPPFRP